MFHQKMNASGLWLLILYILVSPARGEEAALFRVATATFDWQDTSRNRAVPSKIYYPENKSEKSPVVLFSHGLGGSRDGYEFLGRYWASHGFVSVHVQHLGSDATVWQGSATPGQALRAAATDVQNAADRPVDISFAIDQLTALATKDPTWAARLDLERIGCAGHSFGANTAMLIAGQTLGVREGVFRDPRVKAVIAMSEPVPRAMPESVFAKVEVPVFHMTGTRDDSPIGETSAAARRIPFDKIDGAKQYLLILRDGDHMVFARPQTPAEAKLLQETSTAFWQAYLEDSAGALRWLDNEFRDELGRQGTFEVKGHELFK